MSGVGDIVTIGLFGGTFDPIHFGHIHLALELKERCGLKEVWFIPARLSPFRMEEAPFFGANRLEMCRLAIEGIEGFKLIDSEMQREGPSYTIDTIKELLQKYPNTRFALLLGFDAAMGFALWKEAEAIVDLVDIFVGSRDKSVVARALEKAPVFPKKIAKAIAQGIVEMPLMDIEGTTIRKRLKQNLYCGHLLPPKVLAKIVDYIP